MFTPEMNLIPIISYHVNLFFMTQTLVTLRCSYFQIVYDLTLKEYIHFLEHDTKFQELTVVEQFRRVVSFLFIGATKSHKSELREFVQTGLPRDVETFEYEHENNDTEGDEEDSSKVVGNTIELSEAAQQ